jgi:hypothetical protein
MPTGSADDCLVYDALAEARNAADVDFASTQPPTMYFAPGTRNLYARSGWDAGATWAVFTSPPRLVPDHQHMDASNLVLSRGQDTLIVDPSPYGSRSTLTGNALSADSNVVQGDYKPSQTPWSTADMPWERQGGSGIVAARSDYAAAFNFTGTPSATTRTFPRGRSSRSTASTRRTRRGACTCAFARRLRSSRVVR